MESKKPLHLCDVCGEGHLHPATSSAPIEYKGTQGQFIVHYSVCDICKSEVSDASDLLKNKREVVRFKKRIDHVPLGAEIAELRKKHHLTQPLAATIFGGGPVAFSKYENDDLIPDEAMVNLLKLAIAHPDTVRRLAKLKGVELPATTTPISKVEYQVVMRDSLGNTYNTLVHAHPAADAPHPFAQLKKTAEWSTHKKTHSRPISKMTKTLETSFNAGRKPWVLQ